MRHPALTTTTPIALPDPDGDPKCFINKSLVCRAEMSYKSAFYKSFAKNTVLQELPIRRWLAKLQFFVIPRKLLMIQSFDNL
jgi:hypothetical protein